MLFETANLLLTQNLNKLDDEQLFDLFIANSEHEEVLRKRFVDLCVASYDAKKHNESIKEIMFAHLAGREDENLVFSFLRAKGGSFKHIKTKTLFKGTVNSAVVHIIPIAREAIKLGADAVCAAHNHPSGSPNFSDADYEMTTKLDKALSNLGVALLDHFVITDEVTSMKNAAVQNIKYFVNSEKILKKLNVSEYRSAYQRY